MNKRVDFPVHEIDPDEISHNNSANPAFESVLQARLSRRSMLQGTVGTAATALFGSLATTACGGSSDDEEKLLAFAAVAKTTADTVTVPAGYTVRPLIALGDPLAAGVAAYKNDGTDGDFANRSGDHHDGMEYFGLASDGKPDANGSSRGVLMINHEATTDERLSSFFVHADGGTSTLPRPAAEVDKEVDLHGIAAVEVRNNNGRWEYVQGSAFNRRLTALSEIEINGPARGDALLVTKYAPTGTKTRGTLNNCGTGKTPWGTFLTGEENWFGYFTRNANDNAARGDKSVVSLNRYGRSQGAASRHGWETGGADDKYARWDISKTGTSADGSDDYRNEMNGMGYVVEIDPYDRTRPAKKRTALGRFAHESACFSRPAAGKPLAVYMGDDSRGEYMYKFVTAATWATADATPTDRSTTGDKYLDNGKLYVAKFNADGTGQWIELSITNPAIAGYAAYSFANQADVVVNARLAADAVGATKMDRPEWCSVNPKNGDVYYTLTNNSNRRVEPSSASQMMVDGPNPRAYTDMKGASTQSGNVNGHIIRLAEAGAEGAATSFKWDVYLFAAEAGADGGKVNLSGLTADQDMSSPDGLWFSPHTGICWIQTDDGAYTDVTNCMMLAGLPGAQGDGSKVTLSYTKGDGSVMNVDTYVGKKPTAEALKRFLVGCRDSEITGVAETPDGKTMFVNIQHPGEGTKMADIGDPSKYTSHWPGNAGYGAGGANARPRSATVVITKNDGGRIGS